MKSPSECNDLLDVRAEIDRLDNKIIAAMGRRLEYVKAASEFKKDEDRIPAPERVAAMLPQRRSWAREVGLDADFVEKLYRELIAWYINEQLHHYRSKTNSWFALERAIDHSRLMQMLRDAREHARLRGRPVLVSLTRPLLSAIDTVQVFEAAAGCSDEAVLWSQADPALSMVGIHTAYQIAPPTADRFRQTALAWSELVDGALIDDPRTGGSTGPLLLGGFSFDSTQARTEPWKDFEDACMSLPRLQLTMSGNTGYLTLNVIVTADLEPITKADELERQWQAIRVRYVESSQHVETGCLSAVDEMGAATWKALVMEAVDNIRSGQLEKVVLARAVRLSSTEPFAIGRVLDRLRRSHPDAYLFAIRRKNCCFLGATPERLVRLMGRKVEVTALAGTCRCGHADGEDADLGRRLLDSRKDRQEHALVVETLRSTLAILCKELDVPAEPSLLKLKYVQHLFTPISGKLIGDANVLDLVAELHPTPAVGGLPRTAALNFQRRHEKLYRGWYAGPIGWLNAHGDGEFAVALRSALISGNEALLFAGCGIVRDSEPEHEFRETSFKLRTLMSALAPNNWQQIEKKEHVHAGRRIADFKPGES